MARIEQSEAAALVEDRGVFAACGPVVASDADVIVAGSAASMPCSWLWKTSCAPKMSKSWNRISDEITGRRRSQPLPSAVSLALSWRML